MNCRPFFSLCALKLLVSIHIYGEAALYIQKLSPIQSKDVITSESNTSFRAETNSVQDIITDFESDINLLSAQTSVHTSELKKER